jgi:hypothetical protein
MQGGDAASSAGRGGPALARSAPTLYTARRRPIVAAAQSPAPRHIRGRRGRGP